MVFDTLRIDARCVGPDAKGQEKLPDNAVFPAASVSHLLAGGCQENRAIGFLRDQTCVQQAFEGPGHGRIGNAEPPCDIAAARFACFFDQVGDEFDIICSDFGLVIGPRTPEGLSA